MAVFLVPTDFGFDAADFSFLDFSYTEMSDTTGDSADRLGGPPRWACQMTSLAQMSVREAGRWQSLLMKLRGGVNHLGVFDPVRTQPEGTLRGTPTLAGAVVAGATTAAINANGSVFEGDLLQIGTGVGTSQLISIVADAAPSAGTMAITFEAPLRYGFASGTAVTWSYPRFYAKLRSAPPSWSYPKGWRGAGNFKLDLVEAW